MNQPWIYKCYSSQSPLPPPSPSHPSGSSQCTSPEHLSHASNLDWWSVSPLIYIVTLYRQGLLGLDPLYIMPLISTAPLWIKYHDLNLFHLWPECLSNLLIYTQNKQQNWDPKSGMSDPRAFWLSNVFLIVMSWKVGTGRVWRTWTEPSTLKHILHFIKWKKVKLLVSQSCPTLSDPMDCSPPGYMEFLCPWNSPGKNTGVGCHSLLQGIFPTQGSNLGLLHCRQIIYCLSPRKAQMCVYLHIKLASHNIKVNSKIHVDNLKFFFM